MEAVPRLPMICFVLKISPDRQPTDFGKLKQYIRDFYHEDPESYSGEIHKLEALRATAMRPAVDVTGCSVLKKYYCQLHFLQSRFPMGKDGAAAVNFTWRDTYANMVCTLADIRFEIASILYNIGALHSQLGASDSRSSSEGLKLACTHFQCAAWAFQHLKDTYPQPAGVDLDPILMQFMYQVCLAQAQECILEKSMTDNRKATINAKVAAQIVDYYKMAYNALTHRRPDDDAIFTVYDAVGNKLFKSWKRYVMFKLTYYGCIALLYQGQQSEEQQKMGERMAYYQAAFDKLVEATNLTKHLSHPEVIEEALTFTMDVVEGKRKAAKNENEFIYHEEVPDKEALPDIKGAALVKGIPFSVTDLDISGPDIFGRLVPIKAHEASSLYSEEKAKLLRSMGARIDEKDEELVAFMTSLHLDCLTAQRETSMLPQDIIDRCAALSAKPDAIRNLIEAMDKLSDVFHDVEAMLQEIMDLILNEEAEEKEYQEVMGSRPPSIVATDMTREANKYEEAHNKAAESNKTLHKAMTQHIANLRLLELPLDELTKRLPNVAALNLDKQPVVREMQHLVIKVDEMRCQRVTLATQLRESVCSDDITAQLVTRQNDNLETVFQEELQKHSKYVTFLDQNLTAQDNILKALTETYARYAPVRKATMEIMRQRKLTISALMSSYDAYEDLIAKCKKGHEFYRKLETNVTKLLQRVKGTCKVQQEERDTILAKNRKSVSSKKKGAIQEDVPKSAPSAGAGGPKLKDYLDNYKRDKSIGYSVQNPGGQGNDPYYNPSSISSTTQVAFPETATTAYDTTQPWVPSIRPAPVGQEGSCPSIASQDLNPESPYSGYIPSQGAYLANKPYPSDGSHYSTYADQYASYMAQYQQYPTASSPYHMPANYSKTDAPVYSKVTINPTAMNYPSNTPSPQLQGSMASNAPAYPPPAPSPVVQNYPPSYDAYKTPTTAAQAYNAFTAQQQQYSTQSYHPAQTHNVNYPLQNVTPHETYPANVQQMSSQFPNTYQTQNIPQMPNYPSNSASPQHNYPATNTAPQGANYMTPGVNQSSSYPAQAYQQLPSYAQSTTVPQGRDSASVDQSISNHYNSLQSNHTDTNNATYPSQNPSTTSLSHEQQSVGQNPYSQYQNFPTNSYSTPSANQGATQNALVQPPSATTQYSSYIPQMYTSYANNDQYDQTSYTKAQPWQSTYDPKNPQSVQTFYSSSQYPNYTQAGTELQYTPATGASFYTHAGQQINSQTSASTPQPLSTDHVNQQPTYTQGNYYHQPYGYQYTSGSMQSITCDSPSSSPRFYIGQVTTQGQMTPQSPMTYMQASNSNLKLTFSQDGAKSQENLSSSNVDLLSGLDFSLSQDPLVPQQKMESPIKTPSKPAIPDTSVEEKLSVLNITETPPEPVAEIPQPEPITLTPKKSAEDKQTGKFQLKDPFNDTDSLNQFVQEVEKFEKFVEGLTVKTLNGPTPLDIKWKELLELQEKDTGKHSISVARCYPVKNRFPDILPYDNSRVELPSTKDDYINASYVKEVTPGFPDLIVTQLPLPSTFGDFWTMVLEQQVELIVCLLNDSELEGSTYWPCEKGVEMVVGRVRLSLQSGNSCKHWVERIIYVTDSRLSRVVVHLQFTDWPGSSFPSSPGPFLSLVSEALSVRTQQRGGGPCVVHCLSGVGRAGLFLLATAAVCHIHATRTLPDLTTLAANIASWRKNALRDREHFKFAYQALLYYSQDLLMKRGILASRSSFEDKRTKSHTRHPSEDFLLGPPKDVVQPQTSLEQKQGEDSSSESAADGPADPLSQLDPLWSMKRLK